MKSTRILPRMLCYYRRYLNEIHNDLRPKLHKQIRINLIFSVWLFPTQLVRKTQRPKLSQPLFTKIQCYNVITTNRSKRYIYALQVIFRQGKHCKNTHHFIRIFGSVSLSPTSFGRPKGQISIGTSVHENLMLTM